MKSDLSIINLFLILMPLIYSLKYCSGFCNLLFDIFGPAKEPELGQELTIYIQGKLEINPHSDCKQPYLEFAPQMKFSEIYEKELQFKYTRFVGPFALVLISYKSCNESEDYKTLNWLQPYAKHTFKKLLALPTTLVFLFPIQEIIKNSCEFEEMILPENIQDMQLTLTIALQLEVVTNKSSFNSKYKIICSGYCNPTKLNSYKEKSTHSILNLHKKYFYSGNNKQLEAFIEWVDMSFYTESITKQYLCDFVYLKRKYEMLQIAKYCWGKQRTAIEISKRHNISYKYNYYPTWSNAEYFTQDFRNLSKILPENIKGLHLQYFSGYFYFYCKDLYGKLDQKFIDYQIWTSNIATEVFVALVPLWIIVTLIVILSKKSLISSFKQIVDSGLLVFYLGTRGQVDVPIKMRVLILFSIGTFLFWTIYENEIGSLVTVRERLKAFKTAEELFNNGYRFGFAGDCKMDYEEYVCVGNKSDKNYGINYVTRKAYWRRQGRWLNWYFPRDSKMYKEIDKGIECFYVEEEQNIKPFFDLVFSINRYWILETLSRMDQAGFLNKWDEMAQWAEANQQRETFIKPEAEIEPDLIDFWRIVPIVILWGSLCICTVVILIFEILFNWWTFRDNFVESLRLYPCPD